MSDYVETATQSTYTVKVLDTNTNTLKDVTYTDPTSLHAGKYVLGIQLSRIISLLTSMIQTMQKVAVQQSQKLSFFTGMQQANTAQMNTVHSFTQLNGDAWVSDTSSDANTARQSLNTSNQSYIQQVQANNNLIVNTAKQMQTNINQTQEQVTSCSNQLTSIIQEMRSINSAIAQAK